MENKIILDIVKRDVNEIKALIGEHDEILINPSLVRLTLLKAKALCEGLEMLAMKNSEKEMQDEVESGYFIDDEGEEEVLEENKTTVNDAMDAKAKYFEKEIEVNDSANEFLDDNADFIEDETSYLEDDGDDVHIAHPSGVHKVLGENFNHKKSLNDIFSSTEKEYSPFGTKIDNLKTAIGLNDRYLYIRELFGNSATKYEDAINKLNELSDLDEAVDYLEQNFEWKKSEASLKFIDLIKRRFQK